MWVKEVPPQARVLPPHQPPLAVRDPAQPRSPSGSELSHSGFPQPKLVSGFSSPPCFCSPVEHKRREALEKEKQRLQNMDEEEYDALTEEEKLTFNREIQQALWERKRRLESGAGPSRSSSLGSNFPWAHSPPWRPGSSSRAAAMATGDPGWPAESRTTSCLSRVLVAASFQGFPSSPLLPSLRGPFVPRGRTVQYNGGGTFGPSAILELPPAAPDNCPQVWLFCLCVQVSTQGPHSARGCGGCSPEHSHFSSFPGHHLGLWWCCPSPEVWLLLRLDSPPEQFTRALEPAPKPALSATF